MKSFQANLLVALIGCMSTTTFAQDVEKTLVKSFNLNGLQSVMLELDGQVEVQEWDSDIMRIQMTINLTNGNENMLKALIKARRYYLKSKEDNNEFVVFAPGLAKEVTVRGVKIDEDIRYIINAPRNVLVRMADAATSDNTTETQPTSNL